VHCTCATISRPCYFASPALPPMQEECYCSLIDAVASKPWRALSTSKSLTAADVSVTLLAVAYTLLSHCIYLVGTTAPPQSPVAPQGVPHATVARGLARILAKREYGPVDLTKEQQASIGTALRACGASKRLPAVRPSSSPSYILNRAWADNGTAFYFTEGHSPKNMAPSSHFTTW
jgi:hypothetical protein